MFISNIYQKYKIIPSLQEHMYRVGFVAKSIVDNISHSELNKENVITAALLHDMGNVIKFDLTIFPEYLEPEGFEYWKKVQEEFVSKYGTDEHQAHLKIAKEIGVSQEIIDLIDSVGFSKSCINFESKNLEKMIVAYADGRVAPKEITSLDERLAEGRIRYSKKKVETKFLNNFEDLAICFNKMEDYIFKFTNIIPESIDESGFQESKTGLHDFEIVN